MPPRLHQSGALIDEPFTTKPAQQARFEDSCRWRCGCSTISSMYPAILCLPQEKEAKAKRRIGLGRHRPRRCADLVRRALWLGEGARSCGTLDGAASAAAYAASAGLAKEKGAFPLFDAQAISCSEPFRHRCAPSLKDHHAHGIRNGVLTSIAPTGTISLLAGNVSSGIEPVFDFEYRRRILSPDGSSAHGISPGLCGAAVPRYAWRQLLLPTPS